MGSARARISTDVAWTQPRLGRLCEVAAAAISPGRREPSLSVTSKSCIEDEAEDTTEHVTNEFKVVEVDAFASVHDMIHAAIASYGKQATLREIYKACQQRGRIAYKRSGGSRLITHNDHWKSQIRHALYTCDRFARAPAAHDLWTVSASFGKARPQTTKVLIRTDPDAASVNDDSADAQRRQGKQAPRHTRSKHALEEPMLQTTPKQKRSKTTRVAAKRPSPGSSAATRSRVDAVETPSGSMAYSNGHNHVLSASDFSEMGDRAGCAFQHYSYDASTAPGTPLPQPEGEDESSHNDNGMQALPQMYLHDSSPSSFERGIVVQPTGVVHRGCASLPVVDVHPYFTECHDAHQIVASAGDMHMSIRTQSPTPPMHRDQPFVFAPHRLTPLHPQAAPHHQHQPSQQQGLRRSLSAEAESPAQTQVYSLRSRLAPRVTEKPWGAQQPSGLAQSQRPVHKVHDFFMCHTNQAAQAPQTQAMPLCQSTFHDGPASMATIRQGSGSKPPVLPRYGPTQLLLAAAHKAQIAATPTAHTDSARSEQGSPLHEGTVGASSSMPDCNGSPDAAQHGSFGKVRPAGGAPCEVNNGRTLRSKRLSSLDSSTAAVEARDML